MPIIRLAQERSPYLQQHAHNPVDWYPWGEEAFAKAREGNKPIFLSIGYSTCHWCHVMERESFESDSIAEILNANFVSIKVDREERPDVDAVYMSVLQGMTGSGGWPMSLFLTPDLKPFFAGTYYPPIPAHGRPSFSQLIERIHDLWMTEREALVNSSIEITQALSKPFVAEDANEASVISRELLDEVFGHFVHMFDPIEGGFGGAPKFPRPVQFDFLFHYYKAFDHAPALDMALVTLRKMGLGGMHDHLGGGFHRYSVDRYWRISHFEKMLYDQAQLVNSYLDAWQLTHDPFFRYVVLDIIDYVLRDMTHPNGGFFSAEDADSEGEEGKFYVWTLAEIEEALGKNAESFAKYYGITREGNFEHGKNVLYVADPSNLSNTSRATLREKLFVVRKHRIRPLRDDKILTSWNGLMIGAMARAGDVLNEQRYLTAAIAAGEFIWNDLRPNGNLLHRWRDGDEQSSAEARFDAYLDDYAFLIKGYLDLYEATFDSVWMERAILLQEEQDITLYDPDHNGYFDARPAPDLILRAKNSYDGAEPSGNSISVLNLFRLANLTENNNYKNRAEETLRAFASKVRQYPYAMPELMTAIFWSLTSPSQIVFVGNDLDEFRNVVKDRYLPVSVKLRREDSHVAFTRSLPEKKGLSSVYVCQNFVCQLPVTSPIDLEKLLNKA